MLMNVLRVSIHVTVLYTAKTLKGIMLVIVPMDTDPTPTMQRDA